MSLKFDLDPTPLRAAVICVCLFILTFATAYSAITVGGEIPTDPQLITITLGALVAAVTYILGFVGYEGKVET